MPLCAVAVAVENDTPVLVDDVFEQLLDRFVQLVRTGFFQLGCQKVDRFSHDDVQSEDRRTNGLACADCTELEPVPSKGEGAGPVAVARVLWQGRQHVNPDVERGLRLAALGAAPLDLLEDVGELVAEEDGNDCRWRFISAKAMIVPGTGDDGAQEFGVQADCAYDCAAKYQKLSIGMRRVTRIEQIALSRIPQ